MAWATYPGRYPDGESLGKKYNAIINYYITI